MDTRQARSSTRPDAWNERGQAGAFLLTFILALSVGVALFARGPWIFIPTTTATAAKVAVAVTVTHRSMPVPTFTATDDQQTQLSAPVVGAPIDTPTEVVGSIATPTSLAPETTSVALTPTPILVARVANTSGDGVFLRRTPLMSDRWIAWPDNTPMVLVGNETDGDGQHWLEVRDPKNDVGWVPSQFISVPTPGSSAEIR
jgi:hypothetical protein